MNQSQSYTIQYIKKRKLAKNTYLFYFKKPKGFDFIAGQYNRWTLPITTTDGRGSSRFFTISSPPSEKDFLIVTTKTIQSDFKKELLKLHENQKIKIFGPMGQFVIDETSKKEHVFLAGGIGITPFYSMLADAAAKNSNKKLTLFVSFSIPEEAVFLNELTEIAKNHSNLHVIYTITQPQKSQIPWNGETGRISEDMIKKYLMNISQSIFYIVGSPLMVEGTRQMLEDMHVPNEQIKTEQFTGY
jgi:ferredoxin-NADP reductase